MRIIPDPLADFVGNLELLKLLHIRENVIKCFHQ